MTVEQGVIQQFGSGPLFLELRQSLSTLSRPGFLLGGLSGDDPALIRWWRIAVGGLLRRRRRFRGDEAVLFAVAIFEDGGQLGLVWQLHSFDWLDLQDIDKDDFNPAIMLLFGGLNMCSLTLYGGNQISLIWFSGYQAQIKRDVRLIVLSKSTLRNYFVTLSSMYLLFQIITFYKSLKAFW